MSKVLVRKNHGDPGATEWDVEMLMSRPSRPNIFHNKQEFVEWSARKDTDHVFYSFCEGRNANERVTKDNPPAFLHGLVADYDVQNLEQSAVDRAIADCVAAFPVAYVSRTYSKGIRMVWLFERPLPVFNEEIAKGVAKRAIKELKLKKLAPGFDEEAFMDPAKYYELGTDWRACAPDRTIPASYLTTWAFEASQKADFRQGGKSIPLEVVAAEAERRWPGRWQGPFAVGAMGVRFWDPTATNAKGAWIREAGVQAFTGECKFLHWDAIFGREWVAQFEAERIGSVIDNVWYDGQHYWEKNATGHWVPSGSEAFRRVLLVGGLNAEKMRGAPSELDRALASVEDKDRRLQGAFPFLYEERDTVVLAGSRYLNSSRVRAAPSAEGTRYWGEGFPWMAEWHEQMFREQLKFVLSWFSRAFQGARAHKPRQGHAMFIIGPTNSGKTLWATRVVGESLGGCEEATSFIMGDDQFNGKLIESGLWTVDDAKLAADRQKHELYSQTVKKVVANPSMTYRRMYCDPVTLPWKGRLIVTLNMNAIEMLPNIEAELLDKVCFIKAESSNTNFTNAEETITRELPAFLAYLRDYTIPEDLKDPLGDRFGFKSYHHPDLLAEARAAGPSAGFGEILDQWRTHYFTFHDKKTEWSGTSLELSQVMGEDPALTQILKQTVRNAYHFSRLLGQLAAQGTDGIVKHKTAKRWEYRILKP